MTKAENRAAAKAYAEEKERKFQERIQQSRIKADLERLDAIRKYLIFESRTGVSTSDLVSAIDDYVEKLTGDRRTLHAQAHSIP